MNAIRFLACVALLITVFSVFGGVEAQRSSCPLSKPYRCPNNTCVQNSAQCNINPCNGATPYQCSDGTCNVSAIYCNCQGTVCWDGSCKADVMDCPLLPSCPEEFPHRCPNGECDPYNGACVNKTGTPCPEGLVLCIDGICRAESTCIDVPYSGCPFYHCPDGTCSESWAPCECSPGVARCYDGTCEVIGSEWPKCNVTAPAFINPNNVTATTETGSSSSFTTTQSDSSASVVTVNTQAGALNGESATGGSFGKRQSNSTIFIDNIEIRGVPTMTTIYSTTDDEAGNWYNVTIASARVRITSELGQVVLNDGLTFGLIFHNVYLIPGEQYCIARLDITSTFTCIQNTVVTPYGNGYGDVAGDTNMLGIFAVIRRQLYICNAICPEVPCPATVYDLKTEDGQITVGTLKVNNKVDIEMQFEVELFENRYDANYGWALTGILIEVGAKQTNLEYSQHSDNYREFTTIPLNSAFPGDSSKCHQQVPFLFVASVRDDGPCPNKRTEPTCPPTYRIVYAYPQDKKKTVGPLAPYPSNPQDFTQNYPMCCTCTYRAELISNMGRTCNQVPLGCFRDANFARAYPNGMTIGCEAGGSIKFTSSENVRRFLDFFGNQWDNFVSPVTGDLVDPTGVTSAGNLAGYVASVSLSDRFDRLDINWAESCNWLKDIYVCAGRCSPFAGMTIGEVIALGNDVVGGCASSSTYNPLDLVACFDEIERTFEHGKRLEKFRPRGFDIVPCV